MMSLFYFHNLLSNSICRNFVWSLLIFMICSRYQTEFSKEQLALLRTMFSEIITSRDGCIESTICLNLCSSLDIKMSKAGAEKFLEDIVNRKWLIYKVLIKIQNTLQYYVINFIFLWHLQDGYYYMGVRSITELMPYFRATYESNLNTCCLCKQVIFHVCYFYLICLFHVRNFNLILIIFIN